MKINVLDHGYVELIDSMGDDRRVVQSARLSFNQEPFDNERDTKLIQYLLSHNHSSPFEQVVLTYKLHLPIFVMRQIIRTRMARVNEVSARYTQLPEEFYIPHPDNIRTQGIANKQGSDLPLTHGLAVQCQEELIRACKDSFDTYYNLINSGVSRETARIVLPLNTYTTVIWQIDLNNLMKFLSQRLHPHAQWETQQYAKAIYECAKTVAPTTLAIWDSLSKDRLH